MRSHVHVTGSRAGRLRSHSTAAAAVAPTATRRAGADAGIAVTTRGHHSLREVRGGALPAWRWPEAASRLR